MEAQVLIKLSAMIDKMDLDLSNIEGKNDAELAAKVINAIVRRIYKVENEVYELISKYKNIDIEEAKKENVIPIIKEIMNVEGIMNFLN